MIIVRDINFVVSEYKRLVLKIHKVIGVDTKNDFSYFGLT